MRYYLNLYLRTIIGRAYPRVIGANREPSWIFYEILLPLLSTFAFVYVYKALGAPEQFVGFVVLGGAAIAFWGNVLWSMGAQFYWERDSGNLDIFIVSPTSLMAILCGMALGGMFTTVLRAVAVVTVASLAFGVTYSTERLPELVLVFVVAMAALYAMGMLLSSIYLLWGREAWHINTMLREPIYFFTGFYFPIRSLGFAVALFFSFIPLTLGLDAVRQLLFGADRAMALLPVGQEIAGLFVLAVVLFYLAHRALDYTERRARRDARLSLRGN
ncbi:MAG: ABC transporter permease [Dehalococcoidales bacterium]|nr:ABC transporter permease [Dehalococcoidales bacterium]